MKQVFLAIIFLMFSFNLISQIDLNTKNGFQSFTFGDPFSKYKSEVTSNGDGKYEYLGSCCKKLFTHKVDRIVLSFFEGKLVEVFLIFPIPDYQNDGSVLTNDFWKLKSDLNSYFGIEKNAAMNELPYAIGWVGQKILIDLMFDNRNGGDYIQFISPSSPYEKHYYQNYLAIRSKDYIMKKVNSEF